MSPPSKPTVVVTGFGLFGGYKTNASWEAVKVNTCRIYIKKTSEFSMFSH